MISHKQKNPRFGGDFFVVSVAGAVSMLRVSMPSAFEWLRRFMAKTV